MTINIQKEGGSRKWNNKPSFINQGRKIPCAKKTLYPRPKVFFIIFSIFLATLLFSAGVLAALNVALSNQATDVRDSGTGDLVNNGNLTVFVYDALSGGNLVYSEVFNGSIINGRWNVMIVAKASNTMALELGRQYYID